MQWTVASEEELPAVAESLLAQVSPSATGATVLTLSGTLGAGKTTLTRAIARALGVTAHIKSPTFIIEARYALEGGWKQLIHIDAYRLESATQMAPLRFAETLAQPHTLIVVEWPEHIAAALPHDAIRVHIDTQEDGIRCIQVSV